MPDESDLQRLYDEHAQALFAFLLNFTRDEHDTHDLLQEIFTRWRGSPDCCAARGMNPAIRSRERLFRRDLQQERRAMVLLQQVARDICAACRGGA